MIIESVRNIIIPGFDEVKRRSIDAGVLGGGIIGSGPSVFMLSKEKITAQAVAKEMEDVFEKIGIDYHTYVTSINQHGVKIAGL